MGQILNRRTGAFLVFLVCLALIDIHLFLIIRPHFKELPNTEVWFCLAWVGIVTETGLAAIWYKLTKEKP